MLIRYSPARVESVLRRPTKRISVCHPVDWEDRNHLREDNCRPRATSHPTELHLNAVNWD